MVIIISAPESVAILAASSFAVIPPVPTELAEPLPIFIKLSSINGTSSTKVASGFLLGSSVNSPSISDNRISKSAPIIDATMAESLSLSPNSISWVDTVSFSLTIGITPIDNNWSNVFCAL